MENAALVSRKRQVLLLCFALYLVAYLCRSNLSAVLDLLIRDIRITKSQAGLAGTLFFWTYAAGQVINGYFAERRSPKRMATLGISMALSCNLAIAIFPNYYVLLVCWGINGFSLSMLWPAIFKILSNWYAPEEYGRISVLISLPTTIGYILSWSGLRILAANAGWRTAFIIPAALAVVFVAIWVFFLAAEPKQGRSAAQAKERVEPKEVKEFRLTSFLVLSGLIFIGVIAIIQGFIKESVNLWAPTFLNEMNPTVNNNVLSIFSIFIPIIGTCGFFFTGSLIKRYNNASFQPLFILGVLGALLSAGLWLLSSRLLPVIVLNGLLMAVLSGINLMITTFIPLSFTNVKKPAQIAGMLNFLVYIGAAIGGVASGHIGGTAGWGFTFLVWFGLSAVSIFATLAWSWLQKTKHAALADHFHPDEDRGQIDFKEEIG